LLGNQHLLSLVAVEDHVMFVLLSVHNNSVSSNWTLIKLGLLTAVAAG